METKQAELDISEHTIKTVGTQKRLVLWDIPSTISHSSAEKSVAHTRPIWLYGEMLT